MEKTGEPEKTTIPQLSQRLGILKKLSFHSSKKKLKMLASGLFYSKLSYCLPLYTATWGLDSYNYSNTRSISYTKEDNRQLQVLQNKLCRLLLNEQGIYYKQNLPTKELLDKCGDLSIHQLGAERTVVMMKKILLSQKPGYLKGKLHLRSGTKSVATIAPTNPSLGLSRSGFIYRGIKLFNQLPEELKIEDKISKFKCGLKKWIKGNISVKP